jgi:predicted SprT family Zn-dependent metalloprotease
MMHALEKCGLSREEGFTIQTLHELGHYEAFRQGLDYRHEDVAWDMAENIARAVYGGILPAWWGRVRTEVRAKEKAFWDKMKRSFELGAETGP